MAYENRLVTMTDPNSFGPLEVMRVGSVVTLKKVDGSPYFERYEPEALSADQFLTLVRDLGEVGKAEQYVSHTTALPVLRGIVRNAEGRPYFFCVQLDHEGNIEKEMAKLHVQCIKLSLF